jgi:cystathionine beta-lyase/cystathionine gamma-synthase
VKHGKRKAHADDTLCVHAGEDRHGSASSLTTDIAQTAVFTFPKVEDLRRYAQGKSDAYIYTRNGNPTTAAAERKIAALEGGEECLVLASGMAVELATALTVCRAGDEIVSMLDVYGGTLHLFEDVLERCGIHTIFVPYQEMGRASRHFSRRTRMLFLESPTNPTLRCVDLAQLAAAAHQRDITVVVDNTFATPILQKPLSLGCDLVVHSATKYLGGHSDLTAGAVAGPASLLGKIRETAKICGATLDPSAAFLLIRGIKTLELRVERACSNAAVIAQAMSGHPKVARVFYPGRESNDGHEIAARQMRAFGMMVSLELQGGGRAAERMIDHLQLWYLAPSLGGVESTVSYPVLSSHVGLSTERLRLLEVSPATVRLSVGIEHPADLLQDLEQALEKA